MGPTARFSIPGFGNFELKTHIDQEHVSQKMLKNRVWEPTETSCVLKFVLAGDLVIDVGANIGYYSVIFARQVGISGSVIAIEPDAKNFELLNLNIKHNKIHNIQLISAAAAATDGQGTLYSSSTNYGDHRIYPSTSQEKGVFIKTVSLDQIIFDKAQAPKLVKIDCKGLKSWFLKA